MQIKLPIRFTSFLAGIFLMAPLAASADIAEFLGSSEIHAWAEGNYQAILTDGDENSIAVFNPGDNDFGAEGEVVILKNLNGATWDVGYRIDLRAGTDIPEAITAAGSGDADDIDIEQVYVSIQAPFFEKDVVIDFGKFVTHMGWEVIPGWNSLNDQITRSILFGYTIPFTHTGIKASFEINDNATFMVMGTNGWDNVDDNNDAKTIGTQLVLNLADNLTFYANGIYGAEQDDENSEWRYVANGILEYVHDEQWTFVVNGVYGHEEDVNTEVTTLAIVPVVVGGVTFPTIGSATVVTEGDADWGGVSGYARCQINDWLAASVRSEFLIDDEGSRTGLDQDLWEITGTLEATITENARVRLEGRYDHSDEDFFDGGTEDNQFLVALNAQVWF